MTAALAHAAFSWTFPKSPSTLQVSTLVCRPRQLSLVLGPDGPGAHQVSISLHISFRRVLMRLFAAHDLSSNLSKHFVVAPPIFVVAPPIFRSPAFMSSLHYKFYPSGPTFAAPASPALAAPAALALAAFSWTTAFTIAFHFRAHRSGSFRT